MQSDATNQELDWKAIESCLPEGWRELSLEMKMVRPNLPAHMGTKITDIGMILRLMFYQVARSTALVQTAAAFSAAGLVSLSAVALHKWYKKLGPYLMVLLSEMVKREHAYFASERWAGYELIAVDATCVQRPGSKGTTARVHSAIRLLDLRIAEVQVTDETGGETLRRFRPDAGQLWIGDRAYANPPGIQWVTEQDADVLVRFNRGSLPLYDRQGRRIDVLSKLAKLAGANRTQQWPAFVHPEGGKPIEGRLCALRLPSDKAQQARRRLRKEQGTKVTKNSLQMAEYVVVFTTVESDKLTCDEVLELYRLRWQIELDYKRDKSLAGLDRLPNFLPETILSWIYAKLILQQIVRKLSTRTGSTSPCELAAALGPITEPTASESRATSNPTSAHCCAA